MTSEGETTVDGGTKLQRLRLLWWKDGRTDERGLSKVLLLLLMRVGDYDKIIVQILLMNGSILTSSNPHHQVRHGRKNRSTLDEPSMSIYHHHRHHHE